MGEVAGHSIVKWHEDLDQPGSKADRPGLNAAMKRIESGASGGLVVARLDRFGRSVQDSANLLARIRAADGVSARSPRASTPPATWASSWPTSSPRSASWSWPASARTGTPPASRQSLGIHVSGRVPTGYRRDENRILEPDPRTAPAMHKLFKRRAAGQSWTAALSLPGGEGRRHPVGQRELGRRERWHIVRNRVYLGEARAGDIVNPDAHEPIVSLAEWNAAMRREGSTLGAQGAVRASCRASCAAPVAATR